MRSGAALEILPRPATDSVVTGDLEPLLARTLLRDDLEDVSTTAVLAAIGAPNDYTKLSLQHFVPVVQRIEQGFPKP